jgi:hypothetical protein
VTEILREEIQRIPTAPPRSVDLLPGLRWPKSFSRTVIWVPLGIMAFIVLFMLLALAFSPEGKLATRATRTAEAKVQTVQGLEQRKGCRGGVRVRYTFATPNGVTWMGGSHICPPSAYTDVQPGDTVPITYVESDPTTSAVTGTRRDGVADFLIALVVAPLLIGLVFLAVYWPLARENVRDRKLFRTGELAKGKVVYIKDRRDIWSQSITRMSSAEVYVRARFESGGEREVVAKCTNEWLLANLPPGAEVHVCAVGERAMLIESYLR